MAALRVMLYFGVADTRPAKSASLPDGSTRAESAQCRTARYSVRPTEHKRGVGSASARLVRCEEYESVFIGNLLERERQNTSVLLIVISRCHSRRSP
jgi:hypothetical protein